jgi:uroporphyrin-III C-methyltransferase/precorrin-2 dehydrogenase/sirohydrochlorin ferrochelatase
MDVFPVFLKLRDRACLVVGGGRAAEQKAQLLLRAGASVTVVATQLTEALGELAEAGRISRRAEPLTAAHVRDQTLVVAATEDEALAQQASALARAAGVPVNVVDRPELSTFVAGAVVDRSPVLVAISTGGAAPVLAREIRSAIERVLPPALGRLARFADRFRAAVRAAIPDGHARRRFWEGFFKGPIAEAVLAGNEQLAQPAMLTLINRRDPGHGDAGIVHLVGAGPGDPELLTLRAQRLLGEADVIVYDRLVDPRVLEHARRDAERILVGKSRGDHSIGQDGINRLLAAHAARGRRVVRLKGGDPFVFGRGGEELEYLRARGVAVEVVPGISAALGCAASAHIPLTHRGLASAVTLVTGESSRAERAVDWAAALAKMPGTIAVYMGVSALPALARDLIEHGRDPSTPAAIVENGTRPGERVIVGTLDEIGALAAAHRVAAPALVVIGDVVRLAKTEAPLAFSHAVNG